MNKTVSRECTTLTFLPLTTQCLMELRKNRSEDEPNYRKKFSFW